MNRRTFTFAALLGWLCPWLKPVEPRMPWDDLTDELFPEYGHYADFEAWTRWMQAEADKHEYGIVLPGNVLDQITLYSICRKLVKGA